MRVATPKVVSGTCILRYLINVRLRHRPISCIVSQGTPARYIAIAAPDRIECVPILSAFMPTSRLSPTMVVASLSLSSIVLDEIRVGSSASSFANASIPRSFFLVRAFDP